MVNVTDPIRAQAQRSPQHTAVIRGDGSRITYAALDQAIDRMAGHARTLGLRPGDTAGLAISGPDEALPFILSLGLARLGVASAEPTAPRDHLRLTFQPATHCSPGNVALDQSWLTGDDVAAIASHQDPEAVLRILGSSGTTGTPKHIPITHGMMAARIASQYPPLEEPGVHIFAMSMGGPWPVLLSLRSLARGGTIVFSNPAHAAEAIRRHQVTWITASPWSLRTILESIPAGDTSGFPSLRMIQLGGSAVPEPLRHQARERLCRNLVSTYGSAEIAGGFTADLSEGPDGPGVPWPGLTFEAVDEDGNTLPPGIVGRLRIRGAQVARCYLEGNGTGERFADGWFYSNDAGTVLADGRVHWTGRMNDVINLGGNKISPELVEAQLLRLPLVVDAGAFEMAGEDGMAQLWTAIVARSRIDDEVLRAFCRHALPTVPVHKVLQMSALPRNANGKLLRMQLAEMARQATQPAQAA